MTRYLLILDGAPDSACFFSTRSEFGAWGPPVELSALTNEYDVLLELTDARAHCRVEPGARIGFIIRSLAVLEEARRGELPGDVLFAPSRLAVLDALAAGRETLVAARALQAGHTIVKADLSTQVNGAGLGADFRDRVLGRTLVYDLAPGAPIDYGMIK